MTMSIGSSFAVSMVAAVLSIIFYMRAYTTKNSAAICWNLILLGHLFGTLFLGLAAQNWKYLVMYGAGVVAAFVVGHVCLWYVKTKGESNTLRDYQGSIFAFTRLGNFFFIAMMRFNKFYGLHKHAT